MKVTVFTPSYNRFHTIDRVYKSLKSQSFKEFEWIIVDDGSTDETESLVNQWITERELDIKYIRQANKGKFKTLVDTVKDVNGEWFLIADSDDEFESDTIETFLNVYESIPDDMKSTIAGVSCLVKDSKTNEVVGDLFPIPNDESYLLSDGNEISYKLGVKGEKWGILKTSVLKEFVAKLPSMEGTRYISESALWSPIAMKYKTVYINIPLRIYYQGTTDTLSSRNIAGRYPLGAWISEREILPCVYKYFWNQPKLITLSAVKMNYAAVLSKKSLMQTLQGFPLGLKLLTILAYPLGLIAVLKYPKKK